jgi:hypothetical protein
MVYLGMIFPTISLLINVYYNSNLFDDKYKKIKTF